MSWLTEVLGGLTDGPTTTHLCRPNAVDPRLVIPTQPRAATAAAMRRHHDARRPTEILIGLAAEAAARVGQLHRAGGELVELPPFGLVEQLAEELEQPNLIAAVGLGPPRRNRKPVLQLMASGGEPVGFAKVGWSSLTRELVRNEAHWLQEIAGRLPAPLMAPEVLLHRTIPHGQAAGIEVVVTSPLPIRPTVRRPRPVASATIIALARCLGTDEKSVSDLPQIAEWRLGAMNNVLDIDGLLERHGDVPVDVGLWHGDLTPWNTATTADTVLLWDWEFAADHRPLGFDLLHREFERIRRAAPGNEQAAIDRLLGPIDEILRPAFSGNPEAAVVDAYRDLYLAELIGRELRLAGEGWRPEELGPLDELAIAALHARLRG